MKKIYKGITGSRLPVDVKKDVPTYLKVSTELKSSLVIKDDFEGKGFFLVLDRYLALIKDNFVVDLLNSILTKNRF